MSKPKRKKGSKKATLVPASKEQKLSKTGMMAIKRTHKGPLPTADEFYKYEQVVPGAGERILSMAEKQQGHKHQLENKQQEDNTRVIKKSFTNELIGMVLSFLFMGLVLGVSYLFVQAGHVVIGSIFGGFDLIGIIITSLGAARRRKREKENSGEKKDG